MTEVKDKFLKRTAKLPKRYQTRKNTTRERGGICPVCDHSWNTSVGPKYANCPSAKHKKINLVLKQLYRKRATKGPLSEAEQQFIDKHRSWKLSEQSDRIEFANKVKDIRSSG